MLARTDDVLAISDVAITASGTATVQAALHGRPMVVVYRLSPLTYRLGRRFLLVENVAMVNLIAGRRIVPELIQDDCTAENIAAETLSLLTNHERAEEMRRGLGDVRAKLGEPGASGRAAEAVLEIAGVEESGSLKESGSRGVWESGVLESEESKSPERVLVDSSTLPTRKPNIDATAQLYRPTFSDSWRMASPAIPPIGAAEVRDESTEHVSEVLVQAGNSDFFVARDVLSCPRGRQMSARFQRRAARDHEIVGEVAIGALAETFSNMARNFPGTIRKVVCEDRNL